MPATPPACGSDGTTALTGIDGGGGGGGVGRIGAASWLPANDGRRDAAGESGDAMDCCADAIVGA